MRCQGWILVQTSRGLIEFNMTSGGGVPSASLPSSGLPDSMKALLRAEPRLLDDAPEGIMAVVAGPDGGGDRS
jgi:hypothetical protein